MLEQKSGHCTGPWSACPVHREADQNGQLPGAPGFRLGRPVGLPPMEHHAGLAPSLAQHHRGCQNSLPNAALRGGGSSPHPLLPQILLLGLGCGAPPCGSLNVPVTHGSGPLAKCPGMPLSECVIGFVVGPWQCGGRRPEELKTSTVSPSHPIFPAANVSPFLEQWEVPDDANALVCEARQKQVTNPGINLPRPQTAAFWCLSIKC